MSRTQESWSWQPKQTPARAAQAALLLLTSLLTGCAALTNPGVDGISVRRLPPELLGESKEGLRTIPLSLLGQKPPDVYRLGPGDVLGIWVEGVLGEPDQPIPAPLANREGQPPALGYPIPVRDNGTISLPYVKPIRVQGLSVAEVEDAIRKTFLAEKVLKQGEERIVVTLVTPRTYNVLVIREDSASPTSIVSVSTFGRGGVGGSAFLGTPRRGTGAVVNLPAYENDVLHALAQTGGLPGTDAVNAVVIERAAFKNEQDREALLQRYLSAGPGCGRPDFAGSDSSVTRIPLRLRAGEPLTFNAEDVILRSGDIVYIEAREAELFYTAGLLPSGEYILPRDYDLDVIEAVTRIGGPLYNGAFGGSNLAGAIIQPGIGLPSPSLLTVLRKVPGGGQVPIRVDMNLAFRDPRERLLIQPGDVLVLQETPGEAITRYFTQVFRLDLFGTIIRRRDLIGTTTLSVPGGLSPP